MIKQNRYKNTTRAQYRKHYYQTEKKSKKSNTESGQIQPKNQQAENGQSWRYI